MRQGGILACILAEKALESQSLEMLFFSNSSTRLRRIGRFLESEEAFTGQTQSVYSAGLLAMRSLFPTLKDQNRHYLKLGAKILLVKAWCSTLKGHLIVFCQTVLLIVLPVSYGLELKRCNLCFETNPLYSAHLSGF
jgi:hypothetical protein